MKLINPKSEYWPQKDLYKQIERCARVCYKSEDKITEDSAKKMVDRLIQAKHLAMLEHGTVYLKREVDMGDSKYNIFETFFEENPYSKVSYDGAECYVTTNLRVIVENCLYEYMEYQCKPTKFHDRRYTMFLTTSIGIVRELLRHRKFSFANESTRFCNYTKTRFNDEIMCIKPSWINLNTGKYELTFNSGSELIVAGDGYLKMGYDDNVENLFLQSLLTAEKSYMEMITSKGFAPQQAREVLPLATKSDIVMTGFKEDWKHFFNLRLYGNTGAPHPDMKVLAQLIKDEFIKNNIDV